MRVPLTFIPKETEVNIFLEVHGEKNFSCLQRMHLEAIEKLLVSNIHCYDPLTSLHVSEIKIRKTDQLRGV